VALTRSFYGFRLQSALPLPFAPPFIATPFSEEDLAQGVVISLGEVPSELRDPVWSSPFVSVAADGVVLIQAAAIGRFLVDSGRLITVQLQPGATPVEIEAFLMGPIAGVLLHQRGILPLHASCVDMNGLAIVVVGRVGSGKSTLAAALLRRGAVLMSDDICPVCFQGNTAPLAVPGSVGLRLWPDAKEVFARDDPNWLPIRPGHAKTVGPPDTAKRAEPPVPRRLGAVIRITLSNSPELHISRLQGPPALSPMDEIVYRLRVGRILGRGVSLFRDTMRLADMVPVFELRRPHGFENVEKAVDCILGSLEGGS
jgi:hypothetical protein